MPDPVKVPNLVITGYAGAGKSSVADLLVSEFGLNYARISFAEPMKVMLGTFDDRARLQEFGTDIVRRYEPDAWVRLFRWHLALRQEIAELGDYSLAVRHSHPVHRKIHRWVTDDCRFPNELATLKDMGWCHVNVWAPRAVRVERLRWNGKLQDESQLEHASEHALDDMVPDYTLTNADNDLAALRDRVQHMMEDLYVRW